MYFPVIQWHQNIEDICSEKFWYEIYKLFFNYVWYFKDS